MDENFARAVQELGAHMGLPQLELDASGSCALEFDQRLMVNFQYRPQEQEFWLYCDLGAPVLGTQVYEDLLQANLFWRTTAGATLSLTSDHPPRAVLAQRYGTASLECRQLVQLLEKFLHAAQDWAEVLQQTDDEAAASETTLSAASLAFHHRA